jgi:ketosteroid isomerase-like protein
MQLVAFHNHSERVETPWAGPRLRGADVALQRQAGAADYSGDDVPGDCKMFSRSKPDIVRSYFAAYRSKDRQVVEDLLTDDFTFTSPYDDAIDKAAYLERCWPNSERIRTNVIEKVFTESAEAFVRYKCVTNDGKEFRNTEFWTFDGDRIREIAVYFGATYRDGAFVKTP